MISQAFIRKIGYVLDSNLPTIKMVTANGSEERVPEIPNARIGISRDFTLVGPIVVSKANDYEFLVGLDVINSINGFIDPNTM